MLYAVIMAGGRGERFWPLSRSQKPKQFLPLLESRTMLQITVDRIKPLIPEDRIYVVANQEHEELIREQLPGLPPENVILEPMGRNTAACIALATVYILGGKKEEEEDPVLVVLPADHLVKDEVDFRATLKAGAELAAQTNRVVTLGITPSYPETGYGYIEMTDEGVPASPKKARGVKRFVEKPDRAIAEEYLAAGNFLWNSGIFIWRITKILGMVHEHLPGMWAGLESLQEAFRARTATGWPLGHSEEDSRVISRVYASWPGISVDKGIMEKTREIVVIPSQFGWDDVGSWEALARLKSVDAEGNLFAGDVVAVETQNCLISSETRLVAAFGVKDLVIVEHGGSILICPRERTHEIGKIIAEIKKKGKIRYL